MKTKQTIFAVALMIGFGGLFISPVVSAAKCGGVDTSVIDCNQNGAVVCPPNPDKAVPNGPGANGLCFDETKPQYRVCTSVSSAPGVDGYCSDDKKSVIGDPNQTGLWSLLIMIINILTAGIGIVAVGGVVYGSILYTSAEGSAEQTKKARTIIANVMMGLLAYVLMYAFLNYIIPGGMFN